MQKEFIKNTLIIGVGRISTQFMSLILLPIYTIFLSPAEYGIGDLIITYAALVLPLATLSLEQGAFRLLVDARKDDNKKTEIISYVLRISLALIILLAVVALVLGSWLGFVYIAIAVGYAISAILLNMLLWFTRGFGDNLGYSKGSIIVGATSLLLSITFIVVFKMGLTGMLLGLTVANLMGVFYLVVSQKLFKYMSFRSDTTKVGKELLSYSLPLVPNSISWWLVTAVDRTIIILFIGAAATGIYAVSVKFSAILVGLFSIFWISWHESASMYINHKDRDVFFSKITNTSLVLFSTLALAIMAAVSIFFPYIIGEQFSEAHLYIPILLFAALMNSLVTLYGSIYAAKKKTKQILNTTLLAAAINVIIMITLIHFLGLFAAAIASVVAYLSMAIFRHIDVKRFVSITINWRRLLLLLPLVLVVTALYYINNPILNIGNVLLVVAGGLYFNKSTMLSIKELLWRKK